jgi:hypothetical protein
MIHYLYSMQCVKLFDIIPLSGDDNPLGPGHPTSGDPKHEFRSSSTPLDRLNFLYEELLGCIAFLGLGESHNFVVGRLIQQSRRIPLHCHRISTISFFTHQNLTGRLQRYVILGYERNRKDWTLKRNNVMLQIIPIKHNFDFDRRNWDIHISIFLRMWTLTFAQFDQTFGMIIIHDAVKNSESSEDYW